MDPTTNEDLFVISGWAPAGTRTAFAQFYREPSTSATYIPSVWTRNVQSEPAASYPGIDALQGKICTDVIFNTSGGAPTVVWPVIANQEAYKAEGFIFLLDPANGGQTVSTATIGEIHAYDLQIGLVSMANGNIGLCSTKWPSGKSFTSERYRWNDLSTPTRDCLEALRLENAPTISNYWAIINGVGVGNLFDYYGSQSYVAELNGSDLSLVWEKQWQHKLKTNGSDDCYPGNARRRQCNFKIVEADTGGLVVCGNTGHNFDDAYIAKLAPCEQMFAYSSEYPLDANGEHHITTDTEWTDDMNIAGSIVVDPGKTLTVNTATIGFAASTQQLRTNIVVQPGGTLVVKNNGHLTSAPECTGQGMWDGVKVLGNGTTTGAGIAILESGAKFSNALTAIRCAEGSPMDPLQGNTSTGGIVQATDATFENNFFDIATRPHTIVDPTAWGPSSFTNCRFARTRALNNPHLAPGERVSLIGSANTEFIGCTFSNTSTVADPIFRGGAIHAVNTGVRVDEDSDDNDRSQFRGFAMAVLHSAFEPTKPAHINAADFTGNLRGAFVAGTPNAIVTNNTFSVADEPLNDLDIEGAYGAYLHGCTGFEFEENTFTASGTDHPKVGAIFKNTGLEDNFFYNNTFNGFADVSDRSVGSLVMGTNADEEGDLTGLRIKCNDYSATGINDHDVAFTGDAVLIAESQGSIGVGTTDPAGNTFANVDQLTCNGNDAQHFYVENAINTFTYWHHQPQQNVELVPHCASEPIDPDGWYQNSAWQYNKPQSCPNDVSGLVDIEDDATTASSADAEFEVLKEVYDNWRDGGDTEGLVDYVKDPQNSSYDVRNRLMNVAPKASKEAWIAAFEREPTMNAWHITQALLANSPLEPSVLSLMARSDLAPFYQDLVRNGQNGGVSIHSIYKSELAHFYAEKSTALQAMLRKSVLSADPAVRALASQALDDHTTRNADAAKLALHYVANDLNAARTLVNTNLLANGKDKDYWVVQDLLVSMKSAGQQPHQLGAGGISTLQGIAANDGIGAAEAQAWLELLGMPTKEKVILPSTNKALLRRTSAHSSPNATSSILSAYPNPSNGPVYLVYDVPEGVTQVQVLVHDATGRLAFGEVVGTKGRVLELPQHALASGLHIATLLFDGIQVGTTKVEIVR